MFAACGYAPTDHGLCGASDEFKDNAQSVCEFGVMARGDVDDRAMEVFAITAPSARQPLLSSLGQRAASRREGLLDIANQYDVATPDTIDGVCETSGMRAASSSAAPSGCLEYNR